MTQNIAALDDILLRMKNVDRTLRSRSIVDAMNSAVELHLLYPVVSDYKQTSAFERSRILLDAYVDYLHQCGVENSERKAYHHFATTVGQYSSRSQKETNFYKTWRKVLDTYQEKHRLQQVSWFR